MVPGEAMVGLVAEPAQLVEQPGDLARDDAAGLQPAQQVDLLLVRHRVQPHPRGQLLRQELGELSQLQQAGVRVLGEVALGEHAEPPQLLVVRLQDAEIARPLGRRHGMQAARSAFGRNDGCERSSIGGLRGRSDMPQVVAMLP